jgi:hypothetical protein
MRQRLQFLLCGALVVAGCGTSQIRGPQGGATPLGQDAGPPGRDGSPVPAPDSNASASTDGGTLAASDGGALPGLDGGALPGADGGVFPGAEGGVFPGAEGGVLSGEDAGVLPGEDSGVPPGAEGGVFPGADGAVPTLDGGTEITHGRDVDESNTGPTGTLTPVSGTVTITTPGTVWEGKDLTGSIEIQADNVTLRNFRVTVHDGYFGILIRSGTNTLIENCEIASPGLYTGITGEDMTVRRCNVHGFENSLAVGSNVIVEECYLHDHNYAPGAHVDGIEWWSGGSYSTVRRNRIMLDYHRDTGCVNLTPYNGGVANDNVVQDNLFYGGTYSLYIRGDGGGAVSGVTVTGNEWVKESYLYGTHSVQAATNVTWSDNQLDDGTVLAY